MEDKIIYNRLGKVEIFEFTGDMDDTACPNLKQEIETRLTRYPVDFLLMNLKSIRQLGSQGADLLLEQARHFRKAAVVADEPLVAGWLLEKEKIPKNFLLLGDEVEAAFLFDREFAAPKKVQAPDSVERRRFHRLPAVLPLQFSWMLEGPNRHEGFAVVTNLSEGGLFAEFIESRSKKLWSEDHGVLSSGMLELSLYLSRRHAITLQGKMIHGDLGKGTMGIEFFGMNESIAKPLRDWFAAQQFFQA